MDNNHGVSRCACLARAVLSLLVLLPLVISPLQPARAQEPDEELLLTEGFSDEALPDWSIEPSEKGGWGVEADMLYGWGDAWAIYDEGYDWGDAGTYLYRFLLADLNGRMQASINLSDDGRYVLEIRGYDEFWFFELSKERPVGTTLSKRYVELGHDPDSPSPYPIWMELRATEGYVELHVGDYDGNPILEFDDHDPDITDGPPLPPGTFAFESMLEESEVAVEALEVWGPPQQEPLPDLIINEAVWRVEEEEDLLVLRVQVQNQGKSDSGFSDVYAELLPLEEGATEPVSPLAPGESQDVFLYLEFPPELRGESITLFINADPGERVEEVDETNNTVQLVGTAPPPGITPTPWTPTDTPEPTNTPEPTDTPEPTETPRIPPTVPPSPTVEIPDDDDDGIPGVVLIIGAGLLTLTLGGLVYGLVRAVRGKPGPEPEGEPEEEHPPVIPPPPVRLLRIWLSEGASGEGHVLHDRHALRAGSDYTLHLQIQPRGAQSDGASDAPGGGKKKRLRVVLYAPKSDFRFLPDPVFMTLPEQGASSEVRYPVRTRAAGHRKLRACVYYGNVLLQSALLEADVLAEGGRRPGGSAIARLTDYVASPELRDLERLSQPRMSLFTNRASDGSHWIGLFAVSGNAPEAFRSGMLHTFGAQELASAAGRLRTLLTEIQGRARYRYRFEGAAAGDAQQRLEQLERDLVKLATYGHGLYNGLFFSRLGADERAEALLHFDELLREPGVISVARCRADATSIPWAALYGLYLDTHASLQLCPVLKQQLLAGRDLLDRPAACRGQPTCPLRSDDGRTICPFGFWGFLHQVEQPLQQVSPTPVDEVPPQLSSEAYEQSAVIQRDAGSQAAVAVAYYPRLPEIGEHLSDLQAVARRERAQVRAEDEREKIVRGMLRQGGFHLYYFYCHGEVEGNLVRLKLGPADRPGYLAAADLDPRWRRNWRGKPHSLVILNACETVAMVPERVGELMLQLRFLGSAGVVGTEIEVRTELAREVGIRLVESFLDGSSVGEAFLQLRRDLLRAYNPLGLVYTYHAPATLHLHTPGDCAWCRIHLRDR